MTRKPYTTLRRSGSQPDRRGWTNLQAKVALFSLIITAMGVGVSAATSFFAFRQLDIANHNQLTPYRAIMYSTKVESYKSLRAKIRDYIDARSGAAFDISMKGLSFMGETLSQANQRRRESIELYYTKMYILNDSMQDDSALWPDNIVKLIKKFDDRQLRLCLAQDSPAIIHIKGFEGRLKFPDCTGRGIEMAGHKEQDDLEAIVAAMGADLRLDQR